MHCTRYCALALGIMVTAASPAGATVGCSVVSALAGASVVPLFAAPDATSQVLEDVPTGSIVFYPQDDLAPERLEGWVWVRYDATQEAIWQSGVYGWMTAESIADCG